MWSIRASDFRLPFLQTGIVSALDGCHVMCKVSLHAPLPSECLFRLIVGLRTITLNRSSAGQRSARKGVRRESVHAGNIAHDKFSRCTHQAPLRHADATTRGVGPHMNQASVGRARFHILIFLFRGLQFASAIVSLQEAEYCGRSGEGGGLTSPVEK